MDLLKFGIRLVIALLGERWCQKKRYVKQPSLLFAFKVAPQPSPEEIRARMLELEERLTEERLTKQDVQRIKAVAKAQIKRLKKAS